MEPTPREVVQRLIAAVPAREWDALPHLYAEDAVVEQPMALPEPVRLVGRSALARHFAAAAKLPLEMRTSNVVLHDTAEAEVVVAEFDYDARNTETGATFTVPNVFVVRVRRGLIVNSRDYSNHVLFAIGLGRAVHAQEPQGGPRGRRV
jgi:ketosteroid isomerase-like protein